MAYSRNSKNTRCSGRERMSYAGRSAQQKDLAGIPWNPPEYYRFLDNIQMPSIVRAPWSFSYYRRHWIISLVHCDTLKESFLVESLIFSLISAKLLLEKIDILRIIMHNLKRDFREVFLLSITYSKRKLGVTSGNLLFIYRYVWC